MNKREFLIKSSAAAAGVLMSNHALASEALAQTTPESRKNWAGNLTYSTNHLDVAKSVAEVQKVVREQARVKPLGARHSFNNIADSTHEQLSLKPMEAMTLDAAKKTVTVDAGVTYGRLAPYLEKQGCAVHNLASLPHISVVGACATGTHGSGTGNGNLSSAVRAFEMVTADGQVVTLSREALGDSFDGVVIGLGALGVITRITLAVQPTFQVAQTVYEDLSFNQLEHHLEEIFTSGYSVSLFTDWQNHRATQAWVKSKVNVGETHKAPAEFFGAKAATRKLHPLAGHDATPCTEQMGIPGPWFERLPHFRMEFTPSSGQELQTEYYVPIEHGYKAIMAVEELRNQITPHLFVTEFRTIAADDLWLSPCYRQTSMTLHFTWKPEWDQVKEVLPLIEARLEPFAFRPHWAKLFVLDPKVLASRYARLPEYRQLLAKYDPRGKFRNAFLDRNVYPA